MDTTRLQRIQDPRETEYLLAGSARSHNLLPPESVRITSPAELTRPLRRLITLAEATGRSWLAWSVGLRLWLLTGAPSLELARERGRPVLQLQLFDEDGGLSDSWSCVCTTSGEWARL
jgi:hypothetical protein